MSRITTDEQTLTRTFPQASKIYMGVERGITLLEAQIDGDHAEGSTTLLLKNVVCADPDQLHRGMTVAIRADAARDRGVDAVFLSYNDGTLVLTVGPNAKTAQDNFYVTIYSSFRLWRVNEKTFPGNQEWLPIPCIGSHRAGFLDKSIKFAGSNSYHPLGRTLNTPRWHVFQDGSVTDGDTAQFNTPDAPLTVTYPTAGEKLISFRCDDSAGERNKTYRTVLMFERTGSNAPYGEVRVDGCKWNGAGWSATITVYGEADRDTFHNQSLVVLFAEDWYGGTDLDGTQQSIGGCYSGASEVIFTGWIRIGSVVVNTDEQSVTFTIDSAEALMRRLTLPSFTFRDGDDATAWHTVSDLDTTKAIVHIVQQHTTLGWMADIFLATFNHLLGILDVPEASFFDQCQQSILNNAFGYVAGSRFGSVTFAKNRNVLNEAERSVLNLAAITFEPRDWLKLQLQPTDADTAQVRLEATLGDNSAVAANHPSTGPAHYGSVNTISGIIVKTQEQLDDLALAIYKRDNRGWRYCFLTVANLRVLEPAFQEFFTVYLPSAYNNRDLHWVDSENGIAGKEFYCVGMAINFGDGFITVDVQGEATRVSFGGEPWTPADPVPTLEQVYGYDQSEVAV